MINKSPFQDRREIKRSYPTNKDRAFDYLAGDWDSISGYGDSASDTLMGLLADLKSRAIVPQYPTREEIKMALAHEAHAQGFKSIRDFLMHIYPK